MAEYRLVVDGWRQITKTNDMLMAVDWVDHKRGDVVDLPDDHEAVDRLVRAGALVPVSDEAAGDVEPEVVEEDKSEVVDQYDDESAFTYGDLQSLAKERGLNAGGSRPEIVERLRAFDAENA